MVYLVQMRDVLAIQSAAGQAQLVPGRPVEATRIARCAFEQQTAAAIGFRQLPTVTVHGIMVPDHDAPGLPVIRP